MRIPLIGLKLSTGALALGAAAYLAGPKIISAAGKILKPVAKTGIKGGIVAFDKGKEVFAEAADTFQDLVSEARSELSAKKKSAAKKRTKKDG